MYKRIIGLVLVDNGIVCRTRNFVSDYLYTDAFIDTNFFDEIVFIDVSKNRSNETLNYLLQEPSNKKEPPAAF
jgi:imidazole glycerol phosphate synthase subunit HisF